MTDYLGWIELWGAVATGIALLFAWQNVRLRQANAVLEMPYIGPTPIRTGSVPKLMGPRADIWEIESVSLTKPKEAIFFEQNPEFDDGGSIIHPGTKDIGRTLHPPLGNIYVSSDEWPCRLEFRISMKSDRRHKKKLVVTMIEHL
ncbi:MAG: hypothetical protein AAGE37_08635 [Pseudomonadota bacterium]